MTEQRATYRPYEIGTDVPPLADVGEIVGGDTALETRDGDTSYIETGRGTTADFDTQVTFRLEPETAPPPAGAEILRMTVDLEWRSTEATTAEQGPFNSFATEGDLDGGGTSFATIFSVQTDSTSYVWVEDLLAIDMAATSNFRASMVTKLVEQQAGYYWRMFTLVPPTGTFVHGRVTYLRVHVYYEGGSIPTRVYPRADGLGMGAPRLMDNRSPYRSERVFGMI